MIRVITTLTRPNTNVPFYFDVAVRDTNAIKYALAHDTRVKAVSSTYSPDGLTHTATADFDSQEELDAFLEDLDVMVSYNAFTTARYTWAANNGCTVDRTVVQL